MDLDKLLHFAVEHGASDIHIQVGASPMLRVGGTARFLEAPALTAEQTQQFALALLPGHSGEQLARDMVPGLDFSHEVPGLSRFRCSVYSHLGTVAMVLRVIRMKIPAL